MGLSFYYFFKTQITFASLGVPFKTKSSIMYCEKNLVQACTKIMVNVIVNVEITLHHGEGSWIVGKLRY